VREALATAAGIREVFVTADAADRHRDLIDAATAAGVPVQRVSGEVMATIAQTVTPQGIIAVCDLLDHDVPEVLDRHPTLVTVLAHVRDPGNAGTVIRASDAAGADAVIFTDASVDVYNGKCVRASAGSLFHLPVIGGVPTAELVESLHRAGLQVLAADGAGSTDLDDAIDDGLLRRPTAWLFGNEAWGLPEEILSLADHVIRVPIHGRADSLNLAAAATVCLYASARAQRRGPS